MSVLPIYIFGNKLLRKKAEVLKELNDQTIRLIVDMFETMHNARGIGLAANQVGELKRIVTIDISALDEPNAENEREDEAHPTSPDLPRVITLINPEVLSEEGKWTMEEGCLSIPDVHGHVERAEKIRVKFRDTEFKEQELLMDGLLARVVLHEIDHLDGILFVDRMKKSEAKKISAKLKAISNGDIEVDYPVVNADEEVIA